MPDNKTIKLYVDDEPMLLSVADLGVRALLDFRDGLLRRNIVWRTPGGKRVKVSSTRMASFTQRHLAIMTMEVTMLDAEAPVVISSQTPESPGRPTNTTYDPPRWAPEPIRARVRPSRLGCSSHKATGRKISGSFSATVALTPR